MATGRPLLKVYRYLMPIPFGERKEDTFLCKGKAFERILTPQKRILKTPTFHKLSILDKISWPGSMFARRLTFSIGKSSQK